MHHEAFALRRRLSALSIVAAIVGSSLLAAPGASALDSPSAGTEPAGSHAAEDRSTEPASPASISGALPGTTETDAGGLESALAHDLDLTPAQFDAQAALAQKAAQATPELESLEGFVSIAIAADAPARLVITGTGADLETAAAELGAELIAPADTVPGPGQVKNSETLTAAPPAAAEDESEENSSGRSADPRATETASSVQSIFTDYLEIYGPEGVQHLQAIMQDASGEYVVRMAEPVESRALSGPARSVPSVEEFEARYTNVDAAETDGPADALADVNGDALVGGLGVLAEGPESSAGYSGASNSTVCSLGFNAFTPDGDAAVLSAGHCTEDGKFTIASLIDPQTSAYYPTAEDVTNLGSFTFSQFGGIENASAAEDALARNDADSAPLPADTGTDVAVIESINADFLQLPAITNWQNPGNVSSTGPLVIGTAEPTLGAPICASGRSTGWSCGTIENVGIFFVRGPDYYLDPTDIRIVEGYGSKGVVSAGGDSGGANVSGAVNVGSDLAALALGVTSAGGADEQGVEWTYGASIGPMLAAAGGYTLQVFVAAPVLTAPHDGAAVEAGDAIHGTAPAGSQVTVTSGGEPLPVNVDPTGDWTFRAPDDAGVLEFTVQASVGFSVSAARNYSVIVEEPAPVIPAPLPAEAAAHPGNRPEIPRAAPVTVALNADGRPSRLPETGMSALLPLTATAGVLLLGGAAAAGFSRRRPVRT